MKMTIVSLVLLPAQQAISLKWPKRLRLHYRWIRSPINWTIWVCVLRGWMLRSVTFLDLTLLHTTTFHHSIFRLLKETVNFFVAQETFVILPKLTFRAQLLTQRIWKHTIETKLARTFLSDLKTSLTSPTRICVSISHVSALAPVLAGNRATGVAHGEACFEPKRQASWFD